MSADILRNVQSSSSNGRKARKTAGENQIVGAKRNTKARISPSVVDHGFHTDKYKTHYSAWTPIIHSASNSQFSMWTDDQRKKFLNFILKKCKKSQLRFVNDGWCKKQLPIHHLDFTTVLPRFISTYIFSFLDPRSLCRAAQTSWHWKFLSEQDVLWMPKCLQFGWYLPYTPSCRENGCWKHHYVMCTYSLDMEAPSKMVETYGQFTGNTTKVISKKGKTRRPPWLDTDPNPSDLEQARKALLYEHNPNLPQSPDQMRAKRLGLSTRPSHKRSHTAPGKLIMSKVIDESVIEQPWSKPSSASPVRRQLNSKATARQSCPNPTVIFISSEIPACELLLDAVMFGVIAIPYDYEGTTLDVLLEKLRLQLNARQAKCIGFFVSGESGTVRLVKDQTLSETTLSEPNMRHFWENVATSISTQEAGGHVDIFLPLAETEQGMDLLAQLGLLTNMQFSCPTGITGSFPRVESEWLFVLNGITPPALYFNMTKLGAWSETVDYIEECVDVVKKNLHSFFNEEQRNLASRLVGQITFEALHMCEIYRISEISSTLVDAVILAGRDNAAKNWNDPVQELIRCLQKNGYKDKKNKETMKTGETSDEENSDGEFEDKFVIASELKVPVSSKEFSAMMTGTSAIEKRTLLAQQILSSELTYMKHLSVIQSVFKKPLEAALASNSALSNDLSNRLEQWNSHQMLGDVFVKFTTQLRAYTNFLNNYPVTLQTLERCKEQNPQFRSFLGRHEKQPNTKMMSLAELLFLPEKQLTCYVQLLESFLRYTPPDHQDRGNIVKAIAKFKDLVHLFRQYKERLERETFLQDLQKRIVNCPSLSTSRGSWHVSVQRCLNHSHSEFQICTFSKTCSKELQVSSVFVIKEIKSGKSC
ncbi:Epithelial cell-transforming sequence 2 oncogene-like [Acropora cervicornis]|uniref:Epithelial cell-transforming sequence 2 oncogene-like n=1 Tax=Acropora cervicornis TaxID=6130 RepID=A0AAD9VE54_ACRCE|nr:Epithelial cell-transforming sequence 2 oncogene-like [Acropora cervicornis]